MTNLIHCRPVKNVRTIYDRFYQKNVKEVQVQFKDEDPAWIPYTLHINDGIGD